MENTKPRWKKLFKLANAENSDLIRQVNSAILMMQKFEEYLGKEKMQELLTEFQKEIEEESLKNES